MTDFVVNLLNIINQQFDHATVSRALILGLLISVGLTQIAKFTPSLDNASNTAHRRATRIWAFFAAFVPCWALWPRADSLAGVFAAVALGLFSPTIYAVVMRVLVWKWPQLDAVVSGRPDPALIPPKD